ncbi:MAG: hypothetical protein IJ745_02410 [Bacteroidales bacterium]|nr:hypothetical protein [Bacteroidales bacterium]
MIRCRYAGDQWTGRRQPAPETATATAIFPLGKQSDFAHPRPSGWLSGKRNIPQQQKKSSYKPACCNIFSKKIWPYRKMFVLLHSLSREKDESFAQVVELVDTLL